MTEEHSALVRATWALALATSDEFAARFYERLFEMAPGVRPMFPAELDEQSDKLMKTLTLVVRSLDNMEQVMPAVRALGSRHAQYGAQPAHYAVVQQVLIDTLQNVLGNALTPSAREAWHVAISAISALMIEAAATPSAESSPASAAPVP